MMGIRISAGTVGWFALLLLVSCANPINDATWYRYTNTGNAEQARGNLVGAEEAHRRAVINAQAGHLGPEKEAISLHNLALVERDLCKLSEAEQSFRRALELRDKNPDTPPRNLSGTMFELAQLQYEQGRYADAASLIERGLPLAEKMNVEHVAPAAYAQILTEYADALRKVNRTADAEVIDARTKALSATYAIDMQQKPKGAPFNHPPCR